VPLTAVLFKPKAFGVNFGGFFDVVFFGETQNDISPKKRR
jgi:hypothetical protein